MTKQDIIRTKLYNKVFVPYGKSVIKIREGTPVYNDYGEIETHSTTEETIDVVPYDLIDQKKDQQPFGELSDGESAMAIQYSDDIQEGDKIVMEDIVYRVDERNPNYLPGNVVTIVKIRKTRETYSSEITYEDYLTTDSGAYLTTDSGEYQVIVE